MHYCIKPSVCCVATEVKLCGYPSLMKILLFCYAVSFSTKHGDTRIYFCDYMCKWRQSLLAVRVWQLEHFAGAAKKSSFSTADFVVCATVFSSLVCLLWVLDTTCKFQCAGSFRAIFRYYLAKIAKLWSSYTCFKSLQTENQKNALYNLREAIAAHLSEDRVSLRDSVVEKTLTNHLVYYFAILLRKNL